jgi:CubicO group peptidase (beta-lactamase class C family)
MNRIVPVISLFALFSTTSLFGGSKPDQVTPEEQRLRDVVALRIDFGQYVFEGDVFPTCELENKEEAVNLIGGEAPTLTFFDRDGKKVEQPDKPGLYLARVGLLEVTKDHRDMQRLFTLFGTAGKVDGNWKFTTETAHELASWAGINPDTIDAQRALIAETLKGRTFDQFKVDPRVARLLAGLSLCDPKVKSFRKNNDGFARERQWVVTLKRANNGSDKAFTKAMNAPEPLADPALTVHGGTPEEAGMKPDSAQKMDAILTEWAANDDQGFAVCVVRNGVIVLHKAYGQRDGKPMTVATKSWMASITKPMSAACMLMLADRKLVYLDVPLDRYLPSWQDIKVEKPLTIRHLYTHTAGLSKWPGEWGSDELPDIESRVALAYPFLKVGKEWAYNASSYTLGGKIIENVSGEAMPLFYLNHLLGPLGMTNTDVTGTNADAQSVPLDMAKFGQMLLNQGSYGAMRFFKPETFEKEMLPHKLTNVLGADATKVFGFGLDGTPENFGHGAASAATFSVDVNQKLIVVMTRNKQGKVYDKYMGKFLDAITAGIEKK